MAMKAKPRKKRRFGTMDQEEIDALEPKYTGNQRDLTEGEAAGIKADPANDTDDDSVLTGAGNQQIANAFGLFRRP
jgi:hypothetical protein